MARLFPFQPYRYAPEAGRLDDLVTQPYDKISPAMRERYLGLSPYNLVRIILGEALPADHDTENVYTRAAAHLKQWIETGVLRQDPVPGFYAYFQDFTDPDTGQPFTRQGFIGLGAVEEYSSNVVYRHEQTLAGPKKDRMELLRRTHAHFGQIFMLYADPAGDVDRLLAEAARTAPVARVTDEYGATHRLWRIADPERVARIQDLMAVKKLLIADGHHRYETALAFRREHPDLPGAGKVMMTFVNLHSPGLRVLATHRLVSQVPDFDGARFLEKAAGAFEVSVAADTASLRAALAGGDALGVALPGGLHVLRQRAPDGRLAVEVLHDVVLHRILGITPEAVRDERHLRYVRGLDAAIAQVHAGEAQVALLLQAAPVDEVARISFAGGVMPQKSTDFYPKLLSGLTVYRLGR